MTVLLSLIQTRGKMNGSLQKTLLGSLTKYYYFGFTLSLSLSHTHTHTHTHIRNPVDLPSFTVIMWNDPTRPCSNNNDNDGNNERRRNNSSLPATTTARTTTTARMISLPSLSLPPLPSTIRSWNNLGSSGSSLNIVESTSPSMIPSQRNGSTTNRMTRRMGSTYYYSGSRILRQRQYQQQRQLQLQQQQQQQQQQRIRRQQQLNNTIDARSFIAIAIIDEAISIVEDEEEEY